MNQETRNAGTQRGKLIECEIGDFVRVGDDRDEPKEANARDYIRVAKPIKSGRTLAEELNRGINHRAYEEAFAVELVFKRAPFVVAGAGRFDIWKRVA